MLPNTLEPNDNGTVRGINSDAQDRLWISQTLAGDPQAYAHLMEKYKGLLFDLACRVLKDRCQGEDILQDAFLKAYRRLKSFRYDSKFSTWIYAIVLNSLRNHLRRTKIIRWSSLDAPDIGNESDYVPEIAYNEPSIETIVESRLDIEEIQRIVITLPLQYQSMFIMHYFQNLSIEEVADRIGRPAATVKVYLHRARKLLYGRLNATQHSPSPVVSPVACLVLAR